RGHCSAGWSRRSLLFNGAVLGRGAVLATVVLLACAVGAGAQGVPVDLPPGTAPTTPVPPFPPLATSRVEIRLPHGRVRSDERVVVGLGPDGTPVQVRVHQRLRILGPGDYSLVVPGPIVDAETAPGSATPAGLRTGALIWQGFSP